MSAAQSAVTVTFRVSADVPAGTLPAMYRRPVAPAPIGPRNLVQPVNKRKTASRRLGETWLETTAELLQSYIGAITSINDFDEAFEFRSWSGARDLNPGPHGPEPS